MKITVPGLLALLALFPAFAFAQNSTSVRKISNMEFRVLSPNLKATDAELHGLVLVEVQDAIDFECALAGQAASLKSTQFLSQNFQSEYQCPASGGWVPMDCKESERTYTGRALYTQAQIDYVCENKAPAVSSNVRSARLTVRDAFVDRLQDQILMDTVVGGGCGTFSSYIMTGKTCTVSGSPGASVQTCQVALDFRTDNTCEAALMQTIKFDLKKVFGLVGADRMDFNTTIEFVKADNTPIGTYTSFNGFQKAKQGN